MGVQNLMTPHHEPVAWQRVCAPQFDKGGGKPDLVRLILTNLRKAIYETRT
jgi:hypothetical protein